MVWSIDDPIFLEEPMIRTHNWMWNPNGFMAIGNAFEAVDELGDKPLGWVPAFPLGTNHNEFAEAHNLPFKATLGGKESVYPEYMDKIKQLAQEEAAEKTKAAAEAAARKTPAKK